MTTHYLDEAEVCDRIAIIDNGVIIACDSPAGLKSALKGDTIYLNTEDDAAAEIELRERFSVEPKHISSGGIAFMVEGAESFIPRLLSGLKTGVKSVNLKSLLWTTCFCTLPAGTCAMPEEWKPAHGKEENPKIDIDFFGKPANRRFVK